MPTDQDLSGAFPEDLDLSEFLEVEAPTDSEGESGEAELSVGEDDELEEVLELDLGLAADAEEGSEDALGDFQGMTIGEFAGEEPDAEIAFDEGALGDEAAFFEELDELPQIGVRDAVDDALPLDIDLDEVGFVVWEDIAASFEKEREPDDLWGDDLRTLAPASGGPS